MYLLMTWRTKYKHFNNQSFVEYEAFTLNEGCFRPLVLHRIPLFYSISIMQLVYLNTSLRTIQMRTWLKCGFIPELTINPRDIKIIIPQFRCPVFGFELWTLTNNPKKKAERCRMCFLRHPLVLFHASDIDASPGSIEHVFVHIFTTRCSDAWSSSSPLTTLVAIHLACYISVPSSPLTRCHAKWHKHFKTAQVPCQMNWTRCTCVWKETVHSLHEQNVSLKLGSVAISVSSSIRWTCCS